MSSSYEEFIRTSRLKRKRRVQEEDEDEEDRISILSDELLHKILSFMNTKYAVQTCVLSKRWKFLWKSLPYLDFNHTTFPCRPFGVDEIKSLKNFIIQVLSRRYNTDLVKVCFQAYNSQPYASIVQGLTAYAIDHNVQQLTIHSGYDWDFVLPRSFYTCDSITALQVLDDDGGNTIKLPKLLALPALKSLHLHGFSLTDKCFSPGDFSACPNLEILKLSYIYFGEDKTLFINAPNLKRLELSFRWSDWGNGRNGRKVVIDAPKLMTYEYRASAPIFCSFHDLACIDDAYFDIYNCYYGYDEEEDGKGKEYDMHFDKYRQYVLHCINIFKKVRRARSLTLSWKTVGALSMFPSLLDANRLPFSNLKYLKISLEEWEQCDEVDVPRCVLNFFLNSFTKWELCIEDVDKMWQHVARGILGSAKSL